jgi:hypothetical protein
MPLNKGENINSRLSGIQRRLLKFARRPSLIEKQLGSPAVAKPPDMATKQSFPIAAV